MASSVVMLAQDQKSFEVATVKQNKSANAAQFIRRLPGGRVTVTNQPVRASLIGFALSAALFVAIGTFAVIRIIQLGAANAAVEHTLMVRAEGEGLMSLLIDAETGQRGYLITGQQEYVEPYNAAIIELPKRIQSFRQFTADDPAQQQTITAFEGLAQRKMMILRDGIAARQEDGFEAAAQIVSAGEGKRVMDAARVVVSQMLAEEDRLWHDRGLVQRDQANRVAVAGVGGLGAAFVLLMVATIFVRR
jgi:CHASE3 domain sensor protein